MTCLEMKQETQINNTLLRRNNKTFRTSLKAKVLPQKDFMAFLFLNCV